MWMASSIDRGRDNGAAPDLVAHEAFAGETFERFAHRCAGHAQTFADVDLAEDGRRLEVPIGDLVPKGFVGDVDLGHSRAPVHGSLVCRDSAYRLYTDGIPTRAWVNSLSGDAGNRRV